MPEDKSRSLYALDALNFCNAGIQTGLGPFISIYYTAVRHWDPGQIGILLACQSLSGIAVQSFVGNWMDESHHKRLLTSVAGIARSESFTHTGNVVFAIAAGAVGTLLALQGIFFAGEQIAKAAPLGVFALPRLLATPCGFVAHLIPLNKKRGRGHAESKDSGDKRIITFTVAVVLFYFANAATLPIIGEILTQGKKGHQSAWQVAAAVVVAETVMISAAIWAGKLADSWGRTPLFLIGFAVLALRNALTVVNHNEFYLISLQALDGIAMGLYGVLLSLVTADLAKGTGRFNFLKGTVQSSMGLGGMLSNGVFGWVAKAMGFNASFLGLAAAAVTGGAFYHFTMPETKPQNENQPDESEKDAAA